jgi:hypothetical protein
MSDCKILTSPKATVFEEALVFLDGNKRIAGSNVQAQASFYGSSSPPEFRTALVSDAPGGQLIFFINEDASGYYITLDGDAKVVAAIGKTLVGKKFRRCDGGPKPANSAPAQPARSYKMEELDAGGIILDPRAKAAYHKALGSLVREPWLAQLDGPSPQNRIVKVAGADYVLASSCKNHDCERNRVLLLYSAPQNLVYGKVFMLGQSILIGTPPPAVASGLERLWQSVWRQPN